jgi:hypothetical protein
MTAVLNTTEYMEKVLDLLYDPTYIKLTTYPAQYAEHKTTPIKGSSLAEDIANDCDHMASGQPDCTSSLRYTRQESP